MTTPQDLIGRKLQDKFVITDMLGEGAMGIVYRGFDEATLDEVAIKVLQPSLAEHEELVSRFHREAAAARRVDHESTVRVLGRGYEGGVHFLVMELLHGRSLAALLAETSRLPEARAARILIQVCGALAVAHERGVVHRDIKPDNIMMMKGGDELGERVKLLDFGIAKRLAPADHRPGHDGGLPPTPGGVEDSFSSGEETRHGALIGTPEYMAPEQCMGREVDQRTDVYSCGVLLYRMVTGQVPFDGTNAHPFELCQRHIGEDPVPPREIVPWIKPAMEAVILKALNKAPDARQQSAVQLRDELAQVVSLIEGADMEPTAPLVVGQLVSPREAARIAAELAATVPVPFDLADTAAVDSDSMPVLRPVQAVISVPPVKLVGVPETAEVPAPRRRPRGQRTLSSYLPTMALAAVIGAGLGTLFMAIAPFVQR